MKTLHLLTPFLKSNRLAIGLGVLLLVAVDFLQLLIPLVVKRVVDDLTAVGVDLESLLYQAGTIVGLGAAIGTMRYFWRRCLIGTSRKVEEGLRNRLFGHLLGLSAEYYDRTATGDLMAHATNDIQHIRMATGMGMVALTDAVVLGSAAIAFMAAISWRLTLLVIIPMPLIVFGTRLFSGKMHRRYRASQAAFAELTEGVRDRLAGIRIVKAHGGEPAAAAKVRGLSSAYVRQNLHLARIVGSFFPMMVLFSNLSLVMVLYFGGRQAIAGDISTGDFVAFISYLGLLTWPMMAMGWVTNLIQRGRASLERIDAILQTQPAVTQRPDALPVTEIRGLTIDSVHFAYPAAESDNGHRPALEGVDLELAAGQVLGIVGPPGSGKSTLLALLTRVYDPQAGQIRIDGRDLRQLQLDPLRALMACVPQEPFLFSGSLRDNILLGNPEAGEDDLRQAAEAAALTETVAAMPDGFDTLVGEKGVILSGGQKQRVGLARALVKPAPLLVLDDPISQVDMETGRRITAGIQALVRDRQRTVIIVSHRLAALRFADRIVTMEAGRITEQGTHARLLERGGYYARAYRLQELENGSWTTGKDGKEIISADYAD